VILREEILKEHSKPHALKIAGYACKSKKNFKELMCCFLDNEYRLSQRAAWSVSWAARKNLAMIHPHIKDLVSVLHKKNIHDAVIRNSVRVLQEVEIPEKFHGQVMDACFQFLEKPSTPVAIKVFSLTTLFNLSKKYPEIKPELKLIIDDSWEHETAAFRSRAGKILSKLKTQTH
jgi:hypothetical protein